MRRGERWRPCRRLLLIAALVALVHGAAAGVPVTAAAATDTVAAAPGAAPAVASTAAAAPPAACTAPAAPTASAAAPARNAITFWGHACCYIDVHGVGIVTDPVFTRHYGLIHWRRTPPPPPAAYARTRFVLISHAHGDHLSTRTLATFPDSAVILCSPAVARYLRDARQRVRIVRPGDTVRFRGGEIVAVPALHPGGRYALRAAADGRALGYVIRTPELVLYWSGDTGYFDGMREIGAGLRPDLAVLDINAHLHGEDARRAVRALGGPRVLPIHFGAYAGMNELRSRGWRRELQAALGARWVPLAVGESLPLAQVARAPSRTSPATSSPTTPRSTCRAGRSTWRATPWW